MNKTRILLAKFKFKGQIIKVGNKLQFKAQNTNGTIFDISKVKGNKIISIFPALNTKICDKQTMTIARLSKEYPKTNIISISLDSPEVQKKWCLAHNEKNIRIVSDKKLMDFSNKTNLYIPKLKTLGRGIIILDKDNVVIKTLINKDMVKQPNFEEIKEFLK